MKNFAQLIAAVVNGTSDITASYAKMAGGMITPAAGMVTEFVENLEQDKDLTPALKRAANIDSEIEAAMPDKAVFTPAKEALNRLDKLFSMKSHKASK